MAPTQRNDPKDRASRRQSDQTKERQTEYTTATADANPSSSALRSSSTWPVDARIESSYNPTYAGHTLSSLENQYASTWPVDPNNGNHYDCTSHIEANISRPRHTQHVVAHNTQHVVEWLERCNLEEGIRAIVPKGFDDGHLPVHLQNASGGNKQYVVPKDMDFLLGHIGSWTTDTNL